MAADPKHHNMANAQTQESHEELIAPTANIKALPPAVKTNPRMIMDVPYAISLFGMRNDNWRK